MRSKAMRGLIVGAMTFGLIGTICLFEIAGLHSVERDLPETSLTPGAIVDVDFETMCKPGYAKSVRTNIKSMRNQIFFRYNLRYVDRRSYEADHLVPISLGGDPTSILNIWPESRTTVWNAEVKDHLEDVLHERVCSGEVPLKEAQEAFKTNWKGAYVIYVGEKPERFIPHERENVFSLNK
jgi:hypothetical protein